MIVTVAEKLRRLEPFVSSGELRALWSLYQMEENPRAKREIESMVDSMLLQHTGVAFENAVMLPPPGKNEAAGELQLGHVSYCGRKLCPFGLRKEELIRHVGLFGQTGSGKTTACMNLLREFVKARIPFLIFDWKRNYRDLLTHPDFRSEDILIFTVGREVSPFRFNPKIPPPGVESHIWSKKLMEIIEKAYLLGPGASDVLMDAMSLPTFADMKRYIDKQNRRGREMLWLSSAKRTLNSLTFPGLNEVVNFQSPGVSLSPSPNPSPIPKLNPALSPSLSPISIPKLLRKNVILELDGLSDSDKTFIIGSLLLWIYFYRMQEPEREILKHMIVIEEAHHLLLRTSKEEDITDVMMREIRELGEGIVILDQHPHKVSVSALGNVYTRIGFQTSLSQDFSSLSRSQLIPTGNETYYGMLKVGEAIVKTGRVPFPFLITVPEFKIDKGMVRDKVIQTRINSSSVNEHPNQALEPEINSFHEISSSETLSPMERILLDDIAHHPFDGVQKRYKKLGMNPREGTLCLDGLLTKGLLKEVLVDRNRLFELTPQAVEHLHREGLKLENSRVRGGLEHNYWVERIRLALGASCRVFLEKDNLDLVADWNGGLAVQVETGKSDIRKNIETLSNHASIQKFMIATNPEALTKIQSFLTIQGIQAYLAKDFIEKIIPIPLTEKTER